ncbi:MAG: tRNA pseudouridine(38-40) synthase TruA [Methylibium sp.]|uniref:tRNA pseudouridine(38-40) synthase TruA n=1 Tax=Methylibium sp. TaxID=2067992 RepID=UPI0017D25629|nr:tRNA pseudouridine(38-40) synthase TruA [Methylibium sp.]MBA3596237.1 tRNA pseudouridine(38-40) synthase TruA [Methylibium sp.]
MQRVALGLSYRGSAYQGWQSQPGGATVQDRVEAALAKFADLELRTICAGRTDTGVHALNQVLHFDTRVERDPSSWVRGTNRYLPRDIAVQWCRKVEDGFHARYVARGRRYVYVLLESPVRPALETGLAGWVFRPLDGDAMRNAAAVLIGEHDFSAFRSAECQAASPVKTMRRIEIHRCGAYWRFEFDASAFLHHMVRNLMGCLVAVGQGARTPQWLTEVLAARDRRLAAPTFAAQGLYFVGPYYDAALGLPESTPAFDWLPRPDECR